MHALAQPAHQLRVLLHEFVELDPVEDRALGGLLVEARRVALVGRDQAELEQGAEVVGLVRLADLVLGVEADRPAQVRVEAVLPLALAQQLDAARDVEILVADAVRLDGDVVRQVPALEQPGGDEVRLELGDRPHQHLHLVPLVLLLLFNRLVPQQADRQPARPGEAQADDGPGELDLATALLADGQVPRLLGDHRPAPDERQREQRQDQAEVEDLPLPGLLLEGTCHD
jgi:hypothetical protein